MSTDLATLLGLTGDGPATRAPATIRVVGPNPALDRIQILDQLRVNAVNRSTEVLNRAGGKSLIVARVVRRLDSPVAVYGFLGGWVGEFIRSSCRDLGMVDRHVPIAGDTRITSVLVEPATGQSTVINEPGPDITAVEAELLLDQVTQDCQPGDLVVCTGSLARGLPEHFHADLVTRIRSCGGRSLVDSSGSALIAAAKSGPWLLKTNLAEFSELTGRQLRADQPGELHHAMSKCVTSGTERVVVTLGADGLYYVDARRALMVRPPRVVARNPTGSGDILLAGLVVALSMGAGLEQALGLGVAAAAAGAARVEPDLSGVDEVAPLLAGVTLTPWAPDSPIGRTR